MIRRRPESRIHRIWGFDMTDATGRWDEPMLRAIELARRGPARDRNPQVGCVIVTEDGRIIAEGWHSGAGTDHAEVAALAALEPGAAHGATAVVTLEPCNHIGTTGPCAQALVQAGVGRVVFGVADPGTRSCGGARTLAEAGVAVVPGVCEEQTTALISDWLVSTRLGRAHVTLKWASSLDGRAAACDGTSQWITGPEARAHVHAERARADAILVGTGTALADDPSLTARDADGALLAEQPVPVVVGLRGLPPNARVFRHPNAVMLEHSHDLAGMLDELRQRGLHRVLVEGGPQLASAFVEADLVDEYLVYLAPTLLGGGRTALGEIGVGTLGERKNLQITRVDRLGHDLLIVAVPTPATSVDSPDHLDTPKTPGLPTPNLPAPGTKKGH